MFYLKMQLIKKSLLIHIFVGGQHMTLLQNKGFEYVEDLTEDLRKKRLKGTLEQQELVQSGSDSYEVFLDRDPYSELRFLRK